MSNRKPTYRDVCLNPFQKPKHIKAKGLQAVTEAFCDRVSTFYPNINTDAFICTNCRRAVEREIEKQTNQSRERSIELLQEPIAGPSRPSAIRIPLSPPQQPASVEPLSPLDIMAMESSPTKFFGRRKMSQQSAILSDEEMDAINRSLTAMGESPVVKQSRSKLSKTYIRSKVRQAMVNLRSKFVSVTKKRIEFSPGKPCPIMKKQKSTTKEPCGRCAKLFSDLVVKFQFAKSKDEQYHILTCAPKTIKEVVDNFGCSKYMAVKASGLKTIYGAFSAPPPRITHGLSDVTKNLVTEFYLSPENSRISPNMRDTVYVPNTSGDGKVKVAKQFMLQTLSEIHEQFIKVNPDRKISVSKFSMLRPKQCVWAGPQGTHHACTCIIHENFSLLLTACDVKEKAGDVLRSLLCEDFNDDCWLGKCNDCPSVDKIKQLTRSVLNVNPGEEVDNSVDIDFYQWLHTDRTDMQKLSLPYSEFVDTISEMIPKIMLHHFLTRKQNEYINILKKDLPVDTNAVLSVDYARNYDFVIQDEVMSYHWTNNQCTLHPFVMQYHVDADLRTFTVMVLSNCFTHDATTFHGFKLAALKRLRIRLPTLKHVHYISDGAGSQYKNFKNFCNLVHHVEDSDGITADWTFTTTAHGKSTCDAISAVVKSSARRESLKGTKILTTEDLLNFCVQKLTSENLEFIYVPKADIEAIDQSEQMKDRYRRCKTIKGSQSAHGFKPLNDKTIEIKKFSLSRELTVERFISEPIQELPGETPSSPTEIVTPEAVTSAAETSHDRSSSLKASVGIYVAFKVGQRWMLGLIQRVDDDQNEIEVTSMTKFTGRNQFGWPTPQKILQLPFLDILCEVEAPTTSTGRIYRLLETDHKKASSRMSANR